MKTLGWAGLVLLTSSLPAIAQSCSPELPGGRRIESQRHVLAYRPGPGPVAVGKPFMLDVVVCARDGGDPPRSLQVDAQMPEHRHGMNYRPVVKASGGGRFEAQGLMFHMPGRWELMFELQDGTRMDRLTDSFVLR